MTATVPPVTASEYPYYNIAQAAARLGVSRVSLWRWIRDGRLPVARLGHRTIRIRAEDLERLLVQSGSAGTQSPDAANPSVGTGSLESTPFARAPRADWWAIGERGHLVQFYETDGFL